MSALSSMSLNINWLKAIRSERDHKVFIETGTYKGGGVQAALDAGYTEVHSVEASRPLWVQAVANVGPKKGVQLYFGESDVMFLYTAQFVHRPSTVFLDAHRVAELPETYNHDCLLLEEIAWLNPHYNQIVLIDDWDLLGTERLDYITGDDVREVLRELACEYTLEVVDGARPESLAVVRFK